MPHACSAMPWIELILSYAIIVCVELMTKFLFTARSAPLDEMMLQNSRNHLREVERATIKRQKMRKQILR
jgi:hypothetical protein